MALKGAELLSGGETLLGARSKAARNTADGSQPAEEMMKKGKWSSLRNQGCVINTA